MSTTGNVLNLMDKFFDEFKVSVSESGKKLLAVCGKESYPRFWRYLAEESLLYTGSGLPLVKHLSSRCIVIPDLCNVTVIIKQKNFPINYFGTVGTFNSNEVSFHI